jgi:hypothetical protein
MGFRARAQNARLFAEEQAMTYPEKLRDPRKRRLEVLG